MLFINDFIKTVLVGSLCFLCISCSTTQEAGLDNNSADSVFQKAPVDEATSQEHLGMAYLLGRGVPENDEKAFYWLEKSANQGSSTAANELGYLYARGKGVSQNYQLALEWYQKAADDGVPSAKYSLGVMYANGIGVTADPARANQYFQEAAALGFAPAQKRPPV